MKKKNKLLKILLVVLLVITLTGCTQTLKDKDGKVVKNEETGQTITENIVCKPTDKTTQKIYEENKVNIKDLPECNKMKISGEYEGLWNSFFVRPLAFIIIKIGNLVGSTAVSIINAVPKSSWFGENTEASPTTNRILKILLPTILPIAISALPLRAAVTEVNSSGKLVPSATIVRPIIRSLRPM